MDDPTSVWAFQASHLIGDCFDRSKPLLDNNFRGLPSLARFVVAQLSIDCHMSSESVLILVREGKEWDADLIGRAVMEGSVKLAYLLHGTSDDVERKAAEYWRVLPLFSAIRHGENAKQFLADVVDPDSPEWMPFKALLVEPDEISATRQKYSRPERRALEEQWSFTGICRSFAQGSDPRLRRIAGLAHGYAMSSHLLHKDADGVGMVWERYGRQPERQLAVARAHAARIVSDVCAFSKLRLLSLLRACGEPESFFVSLDERYAVLSQSLEKANRNFTDVEYPGDG